MSSSSFDRARTLTKGLFGPKKTKPRIWQRVRTRPTLEILEDRNLLSATGGGVNQCSPLSRCKPEPMRLNRP